MRGLTRKDYEDTLHREVATALARLRVRYSPNRRALVMTLYKARQPLTIPEIVAAAPALPQSTVYRNLAIFDAAGVIHRIPGGGGFARYELAEHLMGHHHHLVCSTCGRVEDVSLPPLVEEELNRALVDAAHVHGFILSSHRLDLLGDCTDCEERSGP